MRRNIREWQYQVCVLVGCIIVGALVLSVISLTDRRQAARLSASLDELPIQQAAPNDVPNGQPQVTSSGQLFYVDAGKPTYVESCVSDNILSCTTSLAVVFDPITLFDRYIYEPITICGTNAEALARITTSGVIELSSGCTMSNLVLELLYYIQGTAKFNTAIQEQLYRQADVPRAYMDAERLVNRWAMDAGYVRPSSAEHCRAQAYITSAGLAELREALETGYDAKRRPQVSEECTESACRRLRGELDRRLQEKGRGAWYSRHEILGVITEEYDELVEAVHSESVGEIASELYDLGVACVFGAACLEQETVDW